MKRKKPGYLYAVITAPHNGGHGPWPAVIQLTSDPVKAVETARTVESFGYRINWDKAVVRVERIQVGAIIARHDRTGSGMVVYKKRWGRTHVDRPLEFLEDIFDLELATKLRMTVSQGWLRPSIPLSR